MIPETYLLYIFSLYYAYSGCNKISYELIELAVVKVTRPYRPAASLKHIVSLPEHAVQQTALVHGSLAGHCTH